MIRILAMSSALTAMLSVPHSAFDAVRELPQGTFGVEIELPQGTFGVEIDARATEPGELTVLTVTTAVQVPALHIRAFDRDISARALSPTRWQALVGIDLDTKPGRYDVTFSSGPPDNTVLGIYELIVHDKAFATRRLTVQDEFVNPPDAVVARIADEARRLTAVLTGSSQERLWNTPFVRPVPHPANSAFGRRSVFNGVPRAPHSGTDFSSPEGTPVRAPGTGVVTMAEPLYFTGNTVVIDHGGGLVSLFAHLSRLDVAAGDLVETGRVIGAVGATGRVTGAHLHWALRAGGARVDPISLLALLGERERTVPR